MASLRAQSTKPLPWSEKQLESWRTVQKSPWKSPLEENVRRGGSPKKAGIFDGDFRGGHRAASLHYS